MTPSLSLGLLLLLSSADTPSSNALQQLSAKRFPTRETGQRYLAWQMPRVRLIVQIGTMSEDAETRKRCANILASYRPKLWQRALWWLEAMPSENRWPHFDMVDPRRFGALNETPLPPVLDYLGHASREELFSWYFAKAHADQALMQAVGGPDWHGFRAASLWYAADLEAAGWSAQDVRECLEGLVPVEIEWYRSVPAARP